MRYIGVKSLIFLMIAMFFVTLSADVNIEYKSGLAPEIIKTSRFDDVEYFNVNEMNKVFKATLQEDILDMRLHINLYNEQLIILLDSSYLQYKGKQYNFRYPLVRKDEKYYLPVDFLDKILPLILKDYITYKNDKLVVVNPSDNRLRTIVIDPGHGGKDPGAIGYSKKNYEKNLVLEIAKKLQKKLTDNLNVDVILTRSKDEFVSLQQRTQFANSQSADLFISIHGNAHRSSDVNGVEIYYLSTAKTDEARAVEAMENQVVYDYEGGAEAVKKYDDLAFILADMAQSEHLEESFQLGTKLQSTLISATNARNRGVKQANFYVLRGAFMPAVLLELGFLSNKEEEKKLISPSYQEKLVNALYLGIKDFKYKYDQMQ
ncbi:MAG TPA: N-acetylmuramoyl-L-alanine amidase [Candidatus Cloacimonadota bacterium]|nr:N-acetylmuramoyl-L-alanine amidase [Candidatus Cloacimonadota bacterium]